MIFLPRSHIEVEKVTKIRKNSLTIEALIIDMRRTLSRALERSEVKSLADLKSALEVIQSAASENGDEKAVGLAMDMQSAIDDFIQRGDKSAYIPSLQKIRSAFPTVDS